MAKVKDNTVKVIDNDFGALCVCAIRYCQGRETYMPSLIQSIVKKHLSKIPDRDLHVLIQDCERQKEYGLYGNVIIDKPSWVEFEKTLRDEKLRREIGKNANTAHK